MTAANPASAPRAGLELLALSFTALFLELMLIRWVPSVVQLVAYYANLLLISSFLGLGVGALVCTRGWQLFSRWPLLLLLLVGYLSLCRWAVLPGSPSELRYFAGQAAGSNYLTLLGIFLLNAAVFTALGERIGNLFRALPPLTAYRWDLLGSLLGTVCFAAFSLLFFSPALGMLLVMLVYLALRGREGLGARVVLLAVSLALVVLGGGQATIWSPYYYVTVHESSERSSPPVSEPLPDLRTRTDPPIYEVRVNQHYYQPHGTLDPRRYSDLSERGAGAWMPGTAIHRLPFDLHGAPETVLVLGSGGGMSAEGGVLSGAERVDAVEIDPALVKLSGRFNASGVYDDPRVRVIVDDARSFIQRAEGPYDVVVFSFLDSQALFSSMSNIRLDGYTYTVEGIRAAWELLDDDGLLSLAFLTGEVPWLERKLVGMVAEATGSEPAVFRDGLNLVIVATRSASPGLPDEIHGYRRSAAAAGSPPDLATDDWPYLYLSSRTVPRDYAISIGLLLAVTVIGVGALRGRSLTVHDAHFFFLGMGFLLLQTKSIVDCSLYFGSTWLVTNLMVSGTLVMVLAANAVAERRPGLPARHLYLGLFAALSVVSLTPRAEILALPLAVRLLWTVFVVPLPIFFAGVVFSSSFRRSREPAIRLGANLVGATVGGFSEYLGMKFGYQGLSLLLFAAYGASAACWRR